jgi:hypothetical protein
MNSKVKVVGDANGAVITQSGNNPEYGYVKVTQMISTTDDAGFLRRKSLYALIKGTVEELQECGFYAGQEIGGKIVIEESTTPFNKNNPERDLKVAGSTGVVCTIEGQPIYRRTRWTEKANAEHVTLQHDNVEELRIANGSPVSSAMKANQEFNI